MRAEEIESHMSKTVLNPEKKLLLDLRLVATEDWGSTEPDGVFWGLGLCSRNQLSVEHLPVDVLSIAAVAEIARRRLGDLPGIVLIADTHALENGFDQTKVSQLVGDRQYTTGRILRALGSNSWKIVTGTTIGENQDHAHILAAVRESLECLDQRIAGEDPQVVASYFDAAENPYVCRELADMWYLPNVKVGWESPGKACLDERYFDDLYILLGMPSKTFVRVHCGRSLTGTPACPYLATNARSRMLLHPDEDFQRKGDRLPHATQRYFNNICDIFEETAGIPLTTALPLHARLRRIVEFLLS